MADDEEVRELALTEATSNRIEGNEWNEEGDEQALSRPQRSHPSHRTRLFAHVIVFQQLDDLAGLDSKIKPGLKWPMKHQLT